MNNQNIETNAPPSAARSVEMAPHIAHQVALARSDRRMARWDRSMGIWPKDLPLSKSPNYYRAALAMKVARAFAMEAETGLSHCICHLVTECPAMSWKRKGPAASRTEARS